MLSLRNESHDRSNEVSSSLYQLISLVNIPVVHIPTRENPIVNRLNKTKVEKEVDHEQERADRLKAEATARRIEAQARASFKHILYYIPKCWRFELFTQTKAELALAKAREAEKAARSYDSLFSGEPELNEGKTVKELEEDFM